MIFDDPSISRTMILANSHILINKVEAVVCSSNLLLLLPSMAPCRLPALILPVSTLGCAHVFKHAHEWNLYRATSDSHGIHTLYRIRRHEPRTTFMYLSAFEGFEEIQHKVLCFSLIIVANLHREKWSNEKAKQSKKLHLIVDPVKRVTLWS